MTDPARDLACAWCGQLVALAADPNHLRLSAMQVHDRECAGHRRDGCAHGGHCYQPNGDSRAQ